jgi:GNAT superfamily N-acetyltransferase
MPRMLSGFGLRTTLKVISWVSIWSRHDPAEPHLHLGPIAVDPDAQGRGVGRMLMESYSMELDRTGVVGYLETDRPENVVFYQRFGFVVTGTAPILGVETYFMRRARADRPSP